MTRTAPVMPTEAPGNYDTAALFNATIKALGDWVLGPPVFSGYQASAQSIANNLFTPATLDTELIDTDFGHSTVTNTSRYTFQVAGLYVAWGMAAFATNATGTRASKFITNGTTPIIGSETLYLPATTASPTAPTTAFIQAAVGDYVELNIFQNSGGALSTNSNGTFDWVTNMRLFWISN